MLDYKDITPAIVSYYRGDRLRKCIESLNDCPRILVWDNKTQGEELEKIKKIDSDFDNVDVMYSDFNGGCAVAWNRGIIESDTDWVLLTADDMIFDEDWLDVLNDILEERPHLEQIHLNSFNAMVFHKKTIARMGWWDERYNNFPTCEDDDWYLRTVELLGYSPYGTYGEHYNFKETNPGYLENELNPILEKKEKWFNRKDNFTYFCNSIHSKHKVIGYDTITGQKNDAGGRNNGPRHNPDRKSGMEFHIDKWEHHFYPECSKKENVLLNKDGMFYSRKMSEPNQYSDVLNEYKRKYGDPNMKPISFIQPSRNNLKYLKWSYNSIRKNLGYIHEICMADDFSDDGTWEWMQEIAEKDKNVKIHRNEGPTRLGHTILYDTLINDYATNDIVMIYHADMYALPGLDAEIAKHIKPGVVVSATRIEPPLHPDGPEKILRDYGIEPEEFKEQELLKDLNSLKVINKTTEGIFAPWAIMKEDFQSIGGHDPLYAPQSKEDSDIFNRFLLNGYKFVQTWEGFVYHMTCRGSRFADGAQRNPDGQVFMKGRETEEWLKQNHKSTRNFIRKWGHFVKHDAHLKPIVPPKYDIGFVITGCQENILYELEPWCSNIYVDSSIANRYIESEQSETDFDLSERVQTLFDKGTNDITIEFDASDFNQESFNLITSMAEILANDEELEEGKFELGIFKFTINKLKTYETDLIICK